MSYTILTAVSPDYADMARVFMHTWIRNSGASEIDIRLLSGESWSANIVERMVHIRNAVLQAAATRRLIAWLDADIYIVKPMGGGFSPEHPISITRWPNINAGVIFFNTMIEFDWSSFLDPLLDEITERCRMVDGERGYSDQKIWFKHLAAIEDRVCKLDSDEWNYTGLWENWGDDLARIGGIVRALHTRGNGDWPEDIHRLMAYTFPKEMGVKR